MAHLTNFSFEFFYKIFTEDASQPLLYYGAKKSKMTKNSNQGGSCLESHAQVIQSQAPIPEKWIPGFPIYYYFSLPLGSDLVKLLPKMFLLKIKNFSTIFHFITVTFFLQKMVLSCQFRKVRRQIPQCFLF